MKEKPNSTRTYDDDGFRKRAAGLCVRDGSETEILLVSSSSSPDRFIVPGGGLEPNEDAATAALREVMEEAGVRGSLRRCLGSFENAERRHRTQVFVLQVDELLDEWDDSKSIGRQRRWFSVSSALEELTISKPIQCSYVQLLANRQQQQQQTTNNSSSAATAQQQQSAFQQSTAVAASTTAVNSTAGGTATTDCRQGALSQTT